MDFNIINRTITILYGKVDTSSLSDEEKDSLKSVIEKLVVYYSKEYDDIIKRDNLDSQVRINKLISQMTEYIVLLNDTINGVCDVQQVVNKIYKEIKYDNKKGQFKRKKLMY